MQISGSLLLHNTFTKTDSFFHKLKVEYNVNYILNLTGKIISRHFLPIFTAIETKYTSMNKELKKTITAELQELLAGALVKRNSKAAGEITDHIKDAARHLARKFVKNLPGATHAKAKKSTATDKKPVVKAAVKAKRKPKGAVKTQAKVAAKAKVKTARGAKKS